MLKTKIFFVGIVALLAALIGCNEDSTIGSSIVQDQVSVVVDTNFTVTGLSVRIDSVQSRTTAQLLGRINAEGFGKITSNIVTQFMPSSQIDTSSVTAIDSLMLYMIMANGEFVGDSITPMGFNVYRLTKDLPSPIYSNFNPEGYFNRNEPLASLIYNVSSNSADTVLSDGMVEIKVELPKSLANDLYNSYKKNPANFTSPSAFANNVFKGIYIENSFGSGRLFRSSTTMMSLFYHHTYRNESTGRDTTVYRRGNYFAVTPEVITNNDYKIEVSQDILDRIEKENQHIVMGPVGYGVDMRFPAPEIISSFQSNKSDIAVLNSVKFSVPAERIATTYDFAVPQYLLMVLKKNATKFFADNLLPDNVKSFYATYDAETGCYNFGDMRAFIVDLINKGEYDESDYTFSLLPISAVFDTSNSSYYYSTSQVLSFIQPYMANPVLGRLRLDKAKIKLTYSTQSIEK